MRCLEFANLPENNVTTCAVGTGNEDTVCELGRLGINVLVPCSSPYLTGTEATHADMLMLHLNDDRIILSGEQGKLSSELELLGFSVRILPDPVAASYPDSVILNCAVIKDKIFSLNFSESMFLAANLTHYKVKQGYTKCSTCIVTENAVITEDDNIYDVMTSAGLDVLKISKGQILLKGMDYGFFGGACGKLSRNLLAINGDLRYNSDNDRIRGFLRNYSIDIISLKKGQLEDIGGILPLIEEEH